MLNSDDVELDKSYVYNNHEKLQNNIRYVNANQRKIGNWISEAHMQGIDLSFHHIKGYVCSDEEFEKYKEAVNLLKAGMLHKGKDLSEFYNEFELDYMLGNNELNYVKLTAENMFDANNQKAIQECVEMLPQVNVILFGEDNHDDIYWTEFKERSGWGFVDLSLYFKAIIDYEECKKYDDRIGTFESYHQQHPALSVLNLANNVSKDLNNFRKWYKKLNQRCKKI